VRALFEVSSLSILSVHIIKCAKVRTLFAENKVRFARAEQLWKRQTWQLWFRTDGYVKLGRCRAPNPQSYGVSIAIWNHTVLPATRRKWIHPALTSARQAGTRFTYPGGMEGWVDLGDWLHTETVYPHTDGPHLKICQSAGYTCFYKIYEYKSICCWESRSYCARRIN